MYWPSLNKVLWFSGLLLWNYQWKNVKFQEGVGRHDKFWKTIVKFPSLRVYVYVVVRKVGLIHVVSQYYYCSKIWKEVNVSVSCTFKHQEGCGIFFLNTFLLWEVFLQGHLTIKILIFRCFVTFHYIINKAISNTLMQYDFRYLQFNQNTCKLHH